MSYTKRELVEGAMAELGLASYSFDLMPEQLELALRRLDSMLAEWNGRGLRLSYPIPDGTSDSDAASDSVVPDHAWEAIVTNLAVRIGPSYGKQVSPQTLTTARHSLNTVMAKAAMPGEMQMTDLPTGAGNKQLDQPFMDGPEDALVAGPDSALDFN